MGNCQGKPKTRAARREFLSRKTSSLEDKQKMAKSHRTDIQHRASVVVESLELEDVEREDRPGADKATVHVTESYVPMTQHDRTKPVSNVQIAQSDQTKPATTSYITLPEIIQKPVQEDMRVESVSSKRSFSAENNQERSARSVKGETQLLGNIEKKENYISCDDCTTSIRPVIESNITKKNGSSNMEDTRSKEDCCLTSLPRPESSFVFRTDVNCVSKNQFDTFDIKTANAPTTARIEETKNVNTKFMVSGGLAGGIQQGLRTRNNHGSSARLMSETDRKMMTYDENSQKHQNRDTTRGNRGTPGSATSH